MGAVRRLAAILLLLMFGLPMASLLLASVSTGESSIPVCCRKGGQHHCLDRRAFDKDVHNPKQAQFSGALKSCPYTPAALGAVHPRTFAPAPSATTHVAPAICSLVATTFSPDPCHAQVPAREMRGPPSLL